MALLIVFLTFNIARNRLGEVISKDENELFAVFMFTLMTLANLITNFIRIIYMIKRNCRKSNHPDNLL